MAEVPLTTTSTLSETMQIYYDKRLLERVTAKFFYAQLADKRQIPKSNGKQVYWTRYTTPSSFTTAITEGADITAKGLSATTVTGEVAHYGDGITITELLELTSFSNPVAEAIDGLGDAMADTIDQVVRDKAMEIASTNTIVASGVAHYSNLAATDIFQVADLRKAVRMLKKDNAPEYDSGGFVGIMHPDVTYDIQGDSNWVDAHKYVDSGIKEIYNGEIGKLYNVRFLESSNAKIMVNSGSANTEVYRTLITGKGAYAYSPLKGPRTVVNSPAKGSEQGLYSYVGVDIYFATQVLNGNFAVVVDSAATQ